MDIQLFEHHPTIGYLFIPGIKARLDHEGGGYLVRVNQAGFRSEHEYSKEKTPGKFRILLFGDSFTAGDSVSNKHRYGDVIETLIPNVEVYNFGLPGSGTDQHYLIWQEIAKEYEHDLVVIAVQVENIRRVAAHHRLTLNSAGEEVLLAKPYYELEDGKLVLKNIPVPKEPVKPDELPDEDKEFVDQGGRMLWLRNIVNKMGVKDLAQKLTGYQPLPEYDDPDGREWQLMREIISGWAGEIEKPVILMPIPLYQYVEETASPENYRARFKELAESGGSVGSGESVESGNSVHLKDSIDSPNSKDSMDSPNSIDSKDSIDSLNSIDSKDSPDSKDSFILHDPLPDYYAVAKAERRAFRFEKDIHPTPAHHKLLAESLARAVKKFMPENAEGARVK
jgi:hypothetical protein